MKRRRLPGETPEKRDQLLPGKGACGIRTVRHPGPDRPGPGSTEYTAARQRRPCHTTQHRPKLLPGHIPVGRKSRGRSTGAYPILIPIQERIVVPRNFRHIGKEQRFRSKQLRCQRQHLRIPALLHSFVEFCIRVYRKGDLGIFKSLRHEGGE